MTTHTPVVIVGAGPTGITAATLLAQYGVDCLVLDRWSGVYPQPRAVHLDDEIYRVLNRVGIGAQFAAISRPTLGLRLLDNRHRVLAEFQRDTGVSRHGFPQANMFDQPDLERLLRTNLGRYPRAQLLGDREVTDIHCGTETPAQITAINRADGRTEVFTADYVLGCDGANSIVRDRIGVSMRDMHFAQRWLVVDVDTTAELHQWEGVHQVCDPHRAGTFMRIGDTRYRWEFQLLATESADDFVTLADLRPLIEPWVAGIDNQALTLRRVTEYTFRALVAHRWRAGNIFLLGDAAHLTPPFIGQGMGAGIRDAMNLTWKLAGVLSGSLDESVLATYEQERKPHTRTMIKLALMIGRAMTSGGRFGDVARHTVMPQLHRLPGVRNRIVDSETPPLHRCALVDRSGRSRWLAGRLCPNPDVGPDNHLDDVLGTGFAVVTAVSPTDAQHAQIARRGAVVHVAAPGSIEARWLRHGHARAAVVRPDRAVLCAGNDIQTLCDALPMFGVSAHC